MPDILAVVHLDHVSKESCYPRSQYMVWMLG